MIIFKEKDIVHLFEKSFLVVAKAQSNIVDSFVANSNKIGSGSGEARLYVSSQSNALHSNAFFNFDSNFIIKKGNKEYIGCPSNCFFSKDNLLKYMEDVRSEYAFPKVKYRENVSLLYDERIDQIMDLNDTSSFQVYNQSGDLDSSRFYIGSNDTKWELMRTLSLPKITSVEIYKLQNTNDESDIIYYFELYLKIGKDNRKARTLNKPSRRAKEKIVETQIINDTNIAETVKQTLIKARRGQGKFRRNVLSIMSECPFTKVNDHILLRASHIIPWAECESHEQRVDGYNGLALTPTYDVLFDQGLISFEDDGSLIVSQRATDSIINKLNIIKGNKYNIGNIEGNKSIYLKYHREHVLKKQELL